MLVLFFKNFLEINQELLKLMYCLIFFPVKNLPACLLMIFLEIQHCSSEFTF